MTDCSLKDFENMQDELSQQLFGDKAILVTAPIADFRDSLYPPELEIISGAIEKRVFEFSTGRYCAHKALRTLGIEDFPVIRGDQREPIWPENIVGSISHCHDIAGAAVAHTSKVSSIGLDIENRKQINPNISRHVCTKAERTWINQHDTTLQNLLLLAIFSVKEAVFKCIYQATRHKLQFQQCEVIPEITKGIANVTIVKPNPLQQLDMLMAGIQVTDKHVYSGALCSYIPATAHVI